MPNKTSILEQILFEIQNCLNSELYLAALAVSLTIPDICGKAEYPRKGNRDRYTQWYDYFVKAKYRSIETSYSADMPYLSGEVVYSLRCSFLHAGNPNIEKENIKNTRCAIDKFELRLGKKLLGDTSCVCYGVNGVLQIKVKHQNEKSPAKFARPKKGCNKSDRRESTSPAEVKFGC